MDQEEMKGDFGKALAVCFNLKTLDIGGCRNIMDDFFGFLVNGEKKEGTSVSKPGLSDLTTVKLNFLVKIMDQSVSKITQMCSNLEHLEVAGCENLSEFCIDGIVKNVRTLQFLDINHIPVVNAAFYEVLKGHRPELNVRRFQFTEVDPKDNMLRVPLRIAEKGGKKKGKKKKKK